MNKSLKELLTTKSHEGIQKNAQGAPKSNPLAKVLADRQQIRIEEKANVHVNDVNSSSNSKVQRPNPFARMASGVSKDSRAQKPRVSNLERQPEIEPKAKAFGGSLPQQNTMGRVNVATDAPTTVSERTPTIPPARDEIQERITAKEFQNAIQSDKFQERDVKEFAAALDALANSLDDRDIVGQAIYSILNKLKVTPELGDLLVPKDCGLMIKGLRISYANVLETKTTRSNKRTAKSKDVNEMVDMLKGMQF